jgi:hypothetical protein
LATPLAGEVARAPAVHPWSHGDLAVVFSSPKPKPFDQLTAAIIFVPASSPQ